jgi:hypothetical protein
MSHHPYFESAAGQQSQSKIKLPSRDRREEHMFHEESDSSEESANDNTTHNINNNSNNSKTELRNQLKMMREQLQASESQLQVSQYLNKHYKEQLVELENRCIKCKSCLNNEPSDNIPSLYNRYAMDTKEDKNHLPFLLTGADLMGSQRHFENNSPETIKTPPSAAPTCFSNNSTDITLLYSDTPTQAKMQPFSTTSVNSEQEPFTLQIQNEGSSLLKFHQSQLAAAALMNQDLRSTITRLLEIIKHQNLRLQDYSYFSRVQTDQKQQEYAMDGEGDDTLQDSRFKNNEMGVMAGQNALGCKVQRGGVHTHHLVRHFGGTIFPTPLTETASPAHDGRFLKEFQEYLDGLENLMHSDSNFTSSSAGQNTQKSSISDLAIESSSVSSQAFSISTNQILGGHSRNILRSIPSLQSLDERSIISQYSTASNQSQTTETSESKSSLSISGNLNMNQKLYHDFHPSASASSSHPSIRALPKSQPLPERKRVSTRMVSMDSVSTLVDSSPVMTNQSWVSKNGPAGRRRSLSAGAWMQNSCSMETLKESSNSENNSNSELKKQGSFSSLKSALGRSRTMSSNSIYSKSGRVGEGVDGETAEGIVVSRKKSILHSFF